jgi:hypothetical protein
MNHISLLNEKMPVLSIPHAVSVNRGRLFLTKPFNQLDIACVFRKNNLRTVLFMKQISKIAQFFSTNLVFHRFRGEEARDVSQGVSLFHAKSLIPNPIIKSTRNKNSGVGPGIPEMLQNKILSTACTGVIGKEIFSFRK